MFVLTGIFISKADCYKSKCPKLLLTDLMPTLKLSYYTLAVVTQAEKR